MLQQTANMTLIYSHLATHSSQIPLLSPEHANAMWTLVDYSTISNEAIMAFPASMNATDASATCLSGLPVQNTFDHQQDQELDMGNKYPDLWFNSWVDLFGGDAGNTTAVGM